MRNQSAIILTIIAMQALNLTRMPSQFPKVLLARTFKAQCSLPFSSSKSAMAAGSAFAKAMSPSRVGRCTMILRRSSG